MMVRHGGCDSKKLFEMTEERRHIPVETGNDASLHAGLSEAHREKIHKIRSAVSILSAGIYVI
jgi:hypothetical protein